MFLKSYIQAICKYTGCTQPKLYLALGLIEEEYKDIAKDFYKLENWKSIREKLINSAIRYMTEDNDIVSRLDNIFRDSERSDKWDECVKLCLCYTDCTGFVVHTDIFERHYSELLQAEEWERKDVLTAHYPIVVTYLLIKYDKCTSLPYRYAKVLTEFLNNLNIEFDLTPIIPITANSPTSTLDRDWISDLHHHTESFLATKCKIINGKESVLVFSGQGRNKLVSEIISSFAGNQFHITALMGPAGMGKTWAALEIVSRFFRNTLCSEKFNDVIYLNQRYSHIFYERIETFCTEEQTELLPQSEKPVLFIVDYVYENRLALQRFFSWCKTLVLRNSNALSNIRILIIERDYACRYFLEFVDNNSLFLINDSKYQFSLDEYKSLIKRIYKGTSKAIKGYVNDAIVKWSDLVYSNGFDNDNRRPIFARLIAEGLASNSILFSPGNITVSDIIEQYYYGKLTNVNLLIVCFAQALEVMAAIIPHRIRLNLRDLKVEIINASNFGDKSDQNFLQALLDELIISDEQLLPNAAFELERILSIRPFKNSGDIWSYESEYDIISAWLLSSSLPYKGTTSLDMRTNYRHYGAIATEVSAIMSLLCARVIRYTTTQHLIETLAFLVRATDDFTNISPYWDVFREAIDKTQITLIVDEIEKMIYTYNNQTTHDHSAETIRSLKNIHKKLNDLLLTQTTYREDETGFEKGRQFKPKS